ncbi:fyuA [Symbiodinium microadriaticum]|nr:fyuA [Symbiodinium microadriaticum]
MSIAESAISRPNRRLAATETVPLPLRENGGGAGEGSRAAVLETALKLFAEKGYAGTSVRDIAGALNIKAASLYAHFPSKAHILAELVDLGHEEQLRAVRTEVLASDPAPTEQVLAYVRGHVRTHATYPMLCIVANAELHMLPDDLAEPAMQKRQFSEQLLTDIVDRGIDQGVFDVPHGWLAMAAIGGMGLRVAYWYTPDFDQSVEATADIYGDYAIALSGLLLVQPAIAQDEQQEGQAAESTLQLEEIVVTAQKREQAIQNVPVSMTAISGDMLFEQGATDVREALQLVPNASVDAAGFFAAPRVRGFTLNNNNKSFEPPVGMVLDSIPHTRIPYFIAALFDIERMEVMRGPQGTSFGKNTTAGLIHLISKKPTDEWEGYISGDTGELERLHFEAAVGGPVIDGLNFRIAGLFDERDGYVDNTTNLTVSGAPDRLRERKRTGLRLTAEMPNIWGSSLTIGYERFELYDGGAALEMIQGGPILKERLRSYDPNHDFEPGNWVTSQEFPDFRDVMIERVRGEWSKSFGGISLIAIGGWANMEQTLALDTDFTAAPAIIGTGGDHSPELYGEVRLVSDSLDGLFGMTWFGGESDFILGVAAGKREILDSHFTFGINNTPFWDLVGAAGADTANAGIDPGDLGIPPLFNPATTPTKLDEMDQRFEQYSEDLSVFAHTRWQFLPSWGVELGGRFTTEEKSAWWSMIFTTPEPNTTLRAVGAEEFTATREMELENFQPKVSLNWAPLDNISLFLHWEKGFKGGGFNAFALREGTDPVSDAGFEDDDLTFRDEVATNIGFDMKSRLFSNRMYFNVSLFREVAKDFQVLIRENPNGTIGLGTSRVINAEEALSQGVEADMQWLATSWLTVGASLGILDTEFVSFKDGECPVGNSKKDSDGDGNPRCDQSGKPFPFAPEIGATLSLRTNFPLQGVAPGWKFMRDVVFIAGTLIEYESDQLLDIDLDERKRQDAFTRIKADIGIRSEEGGWGLKLVGENLTNEVTHVRLGDVLEDVIHGSQNQPRLIYLQFRKDF